MTTAKGSTPCWPPGFACAFAFNDGTRSCTGHSLASTEPAALGSRRTSSLDAAASCATLTRPRLRTNSATRSISSSVTWINLPRSSMIPGSRPILSNSVSRAITSCTARCSAGHTRTAFAHWGAAHRTHRGCHAKLLGKVIQLHNFLLLRIQQERARVCNHSRRHGGGGTQGHTLT